MSLTWNTCSSTCPRCLRYSTSDLRERRDGKARTPSLVYSPMYNDDIEKGRLAFGKVLIPRKLRFSSFIHTFVRAVGRNYVFILVFFILVSSLSSS